MEKFIRGKYAGCLVTEIQKQDLGYIKYIKDNSTELYNQVLKANPYKIGDQVIGNVYANEWYTVTKKGFTGTITEIMANGKIRLGSGFEVTWWCFDKVTTVKREYIKLYSRSQVNKFVENTKFRVMQDNVEVGTSKLKRCSWPVCGYYSDTEAIIHIARELVTGTQMYSVNSLSTPKPTKPKKLKSNEPTIVGFIDLTKTTSKSKAEEKKSSSSMLDW